MHYKKKYGFKYRLPATRECVSKVKTMKTKWEKQFDAEFVRDDGLMNKYAYDKAGDTVPTAETIKLFISKLLLETYRQGFEDGVLCPKKRSQKYDNGISERDLT